MSKNTTVDFGRAKTRAMCSDPRCAAGDQDDLAGKVRMDGGHGCFSPKQT
jgi:hypothetical protein